MREIKFIITVVRQNGHVFSSRPFYLNDFESGSVHTWKKMVWGGTLHERQYTGLKDKNGKEIYEGDIIKMGSGSIRKIKYDRFGFWAITPDSDGKFPLTFLETENTDWEILGNVYENPELIN